MSDSIFDKILRNEIPADKVFEDEDVLAFKDINPQAPTHVLVIPKQKQEGFDDFANAEVDPAQVGKLFCQAAKVARELGLSERGYRIVVNQGTDGQQSVPYVHVHILGGRTLNWPPG